MLAMHELEELLVYSIIEHLCGFGWHIGNRCGHLGIGRVSSFKYGRGRMRTYRANSLAAWCLVSSFLFFNPWKIWLRASVACWAAMVVSLSEKRAGRGPGSLRSSLLPPHPIRSDGCSASAEQSEGMRNSTIYGFVS